MRRMATLRSLALRLVPTALATFLLGCSASVTDLGPSQANPLDSEEAALLSDFRAFRNAMGLPDVSGCASLNVSASAHADDMRDHNYLSDMAPDGSVVRTRACDAGYAPACSNAAAVAEAVASGSDVASEVLMQWENDAATGPILANPALIVVGIGRSEGDQTTHIWAMDLASIADPSCTPQ
jgi:uncharacterized protein YkwD